MPALLSSRSASADVVAEAGGEVAILERDAATPYLATGAFLRLASTASIPTFTTAARGYIWNHGLGVDATARTGTIENDGYSAALVGLRYDITFSQRRMGLLRISGLGGFYLAGRTGVVVSDAFRRDQPFADVVPLIDPPVERPTTSATRLIANAAMGTYVRFGTRVRMVSELGFFRTGGRSGGTADGIEFRVGLGFDL